MTEIIPEGSVGLHRAFVALVLLVSSTFLFAINRASVRSGMPTPTVVRHTVVAGTVLAAWLTLTALLASTGLLHFASPPTMPVMIVAGLATAVAIGRSSVGARLASALPLAALVGFHAFRLLVELLLHRAYTEGLMPVQMSFSGRNFDIVTGVTAIPMALWLWIGGAPALAVFLWNTLGLGLLLNVMGVAMLSAPTKFRVFFDGPSNIWVTQAPWVWLPTVLVVAALLGHVLIYRALWRQSRR